MSGDYPPYVGLGPRPDDWAKAINPNMPQAPTQGPLSTMLKAAAYNVDALFTAAKALNKAADEARKNGWTVSLVDGEHITITATRTEHPEAAK